MDTAITMVVVEERARYYAACRDDLATKINALDADVVAAREHHRAGLIDALRAHKVAEDQLRAALDAAPELFQKPRTRVLHGIRVGYQKGKGKLTIADADATVKLIKRHLPEQVDALIRTTEAPIKDAIANLDAKVLKQIGVRIEAAGDAIVIRSADGDLDKLIKALQGDDGLTADDSEVAP